MKKVIVTIIISILSVCSIGGFKIVNNQSKGSLLGNSQEIQDENTTDENLINDEIIIPLEDEENKISTDEVIPSSEIEQNNSQGDTRTVPEKTETKETVSKSSTSKSTSSGKNNTSSSQNVTGKSTTSSKTTSSSKTNKNTSTQTSTSSNTKATTPPSTPTQSTTTNTKTKSNWCFEGGSKHMSGTDAYEHGYYATWQQAWDALTSYMKDFSSGNYYVDQCACGKYYYYCKPD